MNGLNGGYVMIDCKGMNLLAVEEQTITGLYSEVASAVKRNKPIIACNCVYGSGVQLTPINVFAIKEGDTYIFTASILQIRVAPEDKVTIVNLITT